MASMYHGKASLLEYFIQLNPYTTASHANVGRGDACEEAFAEIKQYNSIDESKFYVSIFRLMQRLFNYQMYLYS